MMSDDLVKRLRDTPNWMREGFQDWKDNVRTYDRAPFEAADRIEELEERLEKEMQDLDAADRRAKRLQARIKELEAAHANLKAMIADKINSTGDDPEIMAATRAEWAARAKAAEDKLAKAVEGLENVSRLVDNQYADRLYTQTVAGWEQCADDVKDVARTTLAELTGGKDE